MKTLTLAKSLPIAVCGAALLIAGTNGSAQALTLTATDQGWWSTSDGHGSINDNYITGQSGIDQSFRSYFTFNLTGVSGGEAVTSAVLKLRRFAGAGNSPKNLGLFDVSTSATALDQDSAPNPTIFNDLGTGTSYGNYSVSATDDSEILSFALNSAGVAAINSSLGNSFSIGGTLLGALGAGEQYLFGFSNGSSAQLDLGTNPTAIPTPALLPGLIAMGVGVLRKRKAEAAKVADEA